jgi:hypothetical protein
MRKLLLVLLGFGMTVSLRANPILVMTNQETTRLPAGGLVPLTSNQVQMKSEDLYVSPDAVRAQFEFLNDTDKDVKADMAFPLPDIDTFRFWNNAIGTVKRDSVNFVGFKATSGATPILPKVDQRAFVNGKDETALIVSAGLPVNLKGWSFILDKLPVDTRRRLAAAGAIGAYDPNTERHPTNYYPKWVASTTFYWRQVFPARKPVAIDISYQPVTGSSDREMMTAETHPSIAEYYCIDTSTWTPLKIKQQAPLGHRVTLGRRTDYILKTANNWNGPIGHFRLTLDKLKANNTLSLCWDGELKKIGPTTFESTFTNFAPARDIHMLVIE